MSLAANIPLPEAERAYFRRHCRSGKTTLGLKGHLSIAMLASERLPNLEIAQMMPVSTLKVIRWRSQIAERELAGIEMDRPRGHHEDAENAVQAKSHQRILHTTMDTNALPERTTCRNTRTMAKAGSNHMLVSRVSKDCCFKRYLLKQFKISNDPNFWKKLEVVVELYLNPPENAVVFSADENSFIQALDRTQPRANDETKASENKHTRLQGHGTNTLFAAMKVLTRKVFSECKKRYRHQEFLSFLKSGKAKSSKESGLHVIVDNYPTHKHEQSRKIPGEKRAHDPSLHFNKLIMAKSGREIPWFEKRRSHSTRCIFIRKGVGAENHVIRQCSQREPSKTCLDEDGRGDSTKNRARRNGSKLNNLLGALH